MTATIKPTKYAAEIFGSELQMVLATVNAHNNAYDRHRSVSNRPLRVLEFLKSVPENPFDYTEFDPTFMPLVETGCVMKMSPLAYLMHMKDQDHTIYVQQQYAHGSAVLKLVRYGEFLSAEYDKIANAFNAAPKDQASLAEIFGSIQTDLESVVAGRRPMGPLMSNTLGFKAIYDFYVHGFHTYHWKDVYKAAQALNNPI